MTKQIRIIAVAIFLLAPLTAQAYLDPGSGSYFIQILIGGLVGGALAVKFFFRSIKNFVLKLFRRTKSDDEHKPSA